MFVTSTQMNTDLMPLFTLASRITEAPDHGAVSELCDRLTGMTSYKTLEVAARVADLKGPRGYIHVRVFDRADMREIVSCFSERNEPIEPLMLATLVAMCARSLSGQWVRTEPLYDHPYVARGVLDLLATFEPRPSKLRYLDFV